MHRKLTKEQNDISMIIGTLPKRLQRKFAEDCHNITDNEEAKVSATGLNTVMKGNSADIVKFGSHSMNGNVRTPVTNLKQSEEFGVASNFSAEPIDQMEKSPYDKTTPGILCFKTPHNYVNKVLKNGKSEFLAADTQNSVRQQLKITQQNVTSEFFLKNKYPDHVAIQEGSYEQKWFKELGRSNSEELAQLNDRIMRIIQKNSIIQNWENFICTHRNLMHFYGKLQLNQLKFCCERKVDTYFWKLLFYNVRQNLKTNKSEIASKRLLDLINVGLKFYTELYAQLNLKYLALPKFEDRQGKKFELIAKIVAQKMLIWLGDLSRYKTKHIQSEDFYEATLYYQRAVALIPSNGKPYNQLAVIALQAQKQLEAVYFHMRSLMSSNPIESAKENLLILFDDIRKKYEEIELKRSPLHIQIQNKKNKSQSMRKEVWIYPDGERRLHRTDLSCNKTAATDENRYNELNLDELQQRFFNLYLYLIGKLYTGVGLEGIHEHQKKLFTLLSIILKEDQLKISRSKIQKIVALNIFILNENIQKDARREVRYFAFIFCNDMFGLILRACNHCLANFLESFANCHENSFWDLNTLLQFIKIYTDWLSQNIEIWEPLRSDDHSFIDCWSELQQLFSLIKCALKHQNDAEKLQLDLINLEEDDFLIGFTPLDSGSSTDSGDVANTKILQFYARITKILIFQNCFSVHQKKLNTLKSTSFVLDDLNITLKKALGDFETEQNNHNSDIGHIIMNANNDCELRLNGGELTNPTESTNDFEKIDNQVYELSKLKKELEQKAHEKKMYNEKLEEILRYVDTKLFIEVRPKFLLPDTNCFIDYIEDIIKITEELKRYTLIIPLTVVKELDGLAKGVKVELYKTTNRKQRIHHFDDVSTRAKKSLDFIKTSGNNVKCATTKGSVINSSMFGLVEEENVSNDDKILATALTLSKTLSTEIIKDDKCFIQTELVLITTDRNLRVKALSRNLAVSELNEFLHWATGKNLKGSHLT